MIEGSVDLLSSHRLIGWAADTEDIPTKLTIHVWQNGEEIASFIADQPRPDLEFLGENGAFAFDCHLTDVQDLESISIVAESSAYGRKLPILQIQERTRGYQTFDDQDGDSDSAEKLRRLGLPPRMSGKSVLDLGCNEGFFCIDALARGAASVTGIDANEAVIERARKRDGRVNYIVGSWWDIPDEKYDFIYLLSALHYEPDPKAFLDMLASHLKPDGTLILECGVNNYAENEAWVTIARGDGSFRYPSRSFLINTLLKRYHPRFYSQSVTQEGDPIPRYVYHASLRQQIVILLSGATMEGKTILASLLGKGAGIVHFPVDLWLWQVATLKFPYPAANPVYQYIVENYNPLDIRTMIDKLDDDKAQRFAQAMYAALPLGCDCIVVEGYALTHPVIKHSLLTLMEQANIRIWELEKKS